MSITDILTEKKTVILQKWYEKVLQTYPDDSSGFLKGKKNFFHETVGRLIYDGLDGLLLVLLSKDAGQDKAVKFLDDIVRVRAVQEFNPSDALNFIFLLKVVVRSELQDQVLGNDMYEELLEFETRIDDLIASGFDIYMKCREKLFDLKANEMRNWTYRIVKRSKMVRETSPVDGAFIESPGNKDL